MPDRPQSIPAPPPWIEESAYRETTIRSIDDPEDQEAVRRAGGVFHLALLEATRKCGTTEADLSVTRADLRAVAADLRYTGGYLHHVIRRSAVECSLSESDERLARFAGKISRKVRALAAAIDRRLS